MKKKHVIPILTSLVITSLLATGVTFTWFVSIYTVARNTNRPGEIEGVAVSKYWDNESVDTDKWTDFSLASPANLFIGEMTRIDRLPENHETYFLFRFTEPSDTTTHYQLVVDSIDIAFYSYFEEDDFTVPEIFYYNDNPNQSAFSSYLTTSTNGNLNPKTLFDDKSSMTEQWINEEDIVITPSFITPDTYLYINLLPRLEELQNIIDYIPIQYSPYSITFSIHFRLEMRTVDEN